MPNSIGKIQIAFFMGGFLTLQHTTSLALSD